MSRVSVLGGGGWQGRKVVTGKSQGGDQIKISTLHADTHNPAIRVIIQILYRSK